MYGLRGCEPCVSCMGLGLLKEFKIFESMLENQNLPITSNKEFGVSSQHLLN